MPGTEQLRSRLLKKLAELFQLNQPDLDFGFYRIMHAKAQEVQDFIGTDLLKIVADAFGAVDEARKAELQDAYEKAIQSARDFGVPNPEETGPVKKARAALDALKDTAGAEAEVYDHLYRFFERYYDDGDFISRRYYTRETPGRAAPFAVPYNGEEVKLHWANADQYYIKTSEYFSNFTFDLRQAREVQEKMGSLPAGGKEMPLKVHFRVVEATEGEHGNVKASEQTKRFFIIHKERTVALNEAGELVCNFEYRPDPEKTGQEGSWRDKRNAEAMETILERLENMAAAGGECEKQITEYLRLFKVPAPTESDKQRPLLTRYINQYTARNTMDYFIHKDLGGFLRRELDFYIKNEVMHLDDIENADAPAVESYLAKIKVLRKIAGKLIDFLAQLEDFQKKLWLKKKFIIETNYCITLDRVPEELYAEIVENKEQIQEWVKLGFIEEKNPQITQKNADLFGENLLKSAPSADNISVDALKVNNKLVLDTRFFDEDFKARLLASMENFDEACDGLLIHSENFQALNLLQERYREQVKCIYIDPPYNTGKDGFYYKDSYRHSSWATMNYERILAGTILQANDSAIFSSIDDGEQSLLRELMTMIFGESNFVNNIIWQKKYAPSNDAKWLSDNHDFIVTFAKDKHRWRPGLLERSEKSASLYKNADNDPRGLWRSDNLSVKTYSAANDYPITTPSGRTVNPPHGACWRVSKRKFREMVEDNRIWFGKDGNNVPSIKRFLSEVKEGVTPLTLWTYAEVGHNQEGKQELISYFDLQTGPSSEELSVTTPKPVRLLSRIVKVGDNTGKGIVLDYFAGSGTTAHAVINLNRKDGGKRKYILVEMGDYFDTVLKPRIAKVVYSESWKDGKPTARHTGISHCFKYIRLESYEDTLNNLRFDDAPSNSALLKNPALKEDYMLRYWLDVETRGSQSLLNIDAFANPTAYTLEVKKPGTDEYVTRAVDLVETFNYLIGLRLVHYGAPQEFTATFKRIEDPEAPAGQKTRLVLDGKLQQINPLMKQMGAELEARNNNLRESAKSADKSWWFRKVEGWVPKDPANPNNGQREKVLVVWRKLTDDIERDNLMLDEWFQKMRISTRDFEFDTIYVNGSNNLPNLKLDNENWKVRLIEEEFMKRMWSEEGV